MMRHRKQFVDQLMGEFKDNMLPSLSREEPRAMMCLVSAHVGAAKDGKLPIEFELSELFDAIWLWGKEAGVEFPVRSNYAEDFKEFCNQLMEPWPLEALERAGLEIHLTRKSNMKARHQYEIAHLRRSADQEKP